jgi:hypothetical protein
MENKRAKGPGWSLPGELQATLVSGTPDLSKTLTGTPASNTIASCKNLDAMFHRHAFGQNTVFTLGKKDYGRAERECISR